MQIKSWYWRAVRRFAVVFFSGGVLAIIEELKLLQTGASPELIIYLSTGIGLLATIEKAIRDHKSSV